VSRYDLARSAFTGGRIHRQTWHEGISSGATSKGWRRCF
jgi:hypothetical protein